MKRTILVGLVGLAVLLASCWELPQAQAQGASAPVLLVTVAKWFDGSVERFDDPDRGVTCYVLSNKGISCVATSAARAPAERSKP